MAGQTRKRTGVALLIIGGVLTLVFRFIPESEMNAPLAILSLVPIVMIIVGAFWFWRGRQYAAQVSATDIISDSKPDVLYLRTFSSDASTVKNVASSMLTTGLMSGLATEEEQLTDALRPFGDLIAIGKPGEPLPLPGAARMYATDDEWKGVVERHMQSARLVVLRAGPGDNLMWEVRRSVALVNPRNVLVLALTMKPKDYESFRAKAEPIFKVSLAPAASLRKMGRVSGFLTFGPNWEPTFLALQAPYFRRSVYKPLRRLFKFALRPVFESHGVAWQPPPVSAVTVSTIAVLALFGLFILLAIAISL